MQLEKAHMESFCEDLRESGWTERKPAKLENFLMSGVLEDKVKSLNSPILEKYGEDEVLPKVKDFLQNADEVKVLEALKYGVPLNLRKGKSTYSVTIKLLNHEDPGKNEYVYIQEQEFSQGTFTDRADIALFVNGIPLVLIEGKDPLKTAKEAPYMEGLKQIRRYQKEIRGLFRLVQMGIGAGNRYPYMPVFPCKEIRKPKHYSFWKVNGEENIHELLRPETLLSFIKFFTFFARDETGKQTKILARYMQYRATQKATQRIKGYLENDNEEKNGLVWHWQGSGKTYTMFFTANKFIHDFRRETPLAFMVIDRLKLQKQFRNVLKSIENRRLKDFKIIESMDDLQHTIDHADSEWGIRVVTMQKFQPAEIEVKEVDRKEVLFLIDEAHRTQYGKLGSLMRKVFGKGMFIGFTGTPIFKNERNTFKEFSYPPDELYLDSYFIKQSEQDGFTLPLSYRLVEEEGLEINLEKQSLKRLIKSFEKDENFTNKVLSGKLSKKAKSSLNREITKTRVFLESEKRIERMAKYIHENIREDTENFEFKAMVVAVSRKACALYKQKLDELLDPEESEVVMSYQHNEEEEVIHSLKTRISKEQGTSNWDDANDRIIKKFHKTENPKILIVTDMLLTGFDAPRLKVMYLDKPMYYNRILQAIARTNRPLPTRGKERGLIVDAIGLMPEIQRALGTYEYLAQDNDPQVKEDMAHLISDSEEDMKKFEGNLKILKTRLQKDYDIDIEEIADKIRENDLSFMERFEEAASSIAIKSEEEPAAMKLLSLIKEVLNLYRGMGAEPEKIDYFWDVEVVAMLYSRIQQLINEGKKEQYEVWDEILRWIHKSTKIQGFKDRFEKKIEAPGGIRPSTQERITEYFFTLRNQAEDNFSNPLYREIYKKLEVLKKEWVSRNIGAEDFWEKMQALGDKLESYQEVKKKPPEERVVRFIKMYLQDSAKEEPDLGGVRNKLKEIFSKHRLLETDRKDLHGKLASSLFSINIDYDKALELERELMDMVLEEVKREQWKNN